MRTIYLSASNSYYGTDLSSVIEKSEFNNEKRSHLQTYSRILLKTIPDLISETDLKKQVILTSELFGTDIRDLLAPLSCDQNLGDGRKNQIRKVFVNYIGFLKEPETAGIAWLKQKELKLIVEGDNLSFLCVRILYALSFQETPEIEVMKKALNLLGIDLNPLLNRIANYLKTEDPKPLWANEQEFYKLNMLCPQGQTVATMCNAILEEELKTERDPLCVQRIFDIYRQIPTSALKLSVSMYNLLPIKERYLSIKSILAEAFNNKSSFISFLETEDFTTCKSLSEADQFHLLLQGERVLSNKIEKGALSLAAGRHTEALALFKSALSLQELLVKLLFKYAQQLDTLGESITLPHKADLHLITAECCITEKEVDLLEEHLKKAKSALKESTKQPFKQSQETLLSCTLKGAEFFSRKMRFESAIAFCGEALDQLDPISWQKLMDKIATLHELNGSPALAKDARDRARQKNWLPPTSKPADSPKAPSPLRKMASSGSLLSIERPSLRKTATTLELPTLDD